MVGIKGIRYIKGLILRAKFLSPSLFLRSCRVGKCPPVRSRSLAVWGSTCASNTDMHGQSPMPCHPLPGMAAAVRIIGGLDGKHDMSKESGSWASCQ
jgi:hypothetical protein